MAEGIKIQIYRNETADILTKKLADPEENAGIGSAAAASAALSASMVSRAAVQIRQAGGENEKLDWYVRNTEILRMPRTAAPSPEGRRRQNHRSCQTGGCEHLPGDCQYDGAMPRSGIRDGRPGGR